MRAERFGSYSIETTFAGMPDLSRLKSIRRSFCLCPPPRCQLVRSPALRRPAVVFFGDVNGLCGRFVVRSSLTSVVLNLCDGVNGLYVFIAISFALLGLRSFAASLSRSVRVLPPSLGA